MNDRPEYHEVVGPDGTTRKVKRSTIEGEGIRLAFGMAALCADVDAMDHFTNAALERIGPQLFGIVMASALRNMAVGIVDPILKATAEHGNNLRPGIAALAADTDRLEQL